MPSGSRPRHSGLCSFSFLQHQARVHPGQQAGHQRVGHGAADDTVDVIQRYRKIPTPMPTGRVASPASSPATPSTAARISDAAATAPPQASPPRGDLRSRRSMPRCWLRLTHAADGTPTPFRERYRGTRTPGRRPQTPAGLSGLRRARRRSRARTRAGAGHVPCRDVEIPSVLRKHIVDSRWPMLVGNGFLRSSCGLAADWAARSAVDPRPGPHSLSVTKEAGRRMPSSGRGGP